MVKLLPTAPLVPTMMVAATTRPLLSMLTLLLMPAAPLPITSAAVLLHNELLPVTKND